MSIRSNFVSSLAAAALLLCAAAAGADELSQSADHGNGATIQNGYSNRGDNAPSGASMTADLVLARPLGLAATLLGTVVFVATLPFALIAGDVSDPARRLVGDPARYTFTRPLGEDVN